MIRYKIFKSVYLSQNSTLFYLDDKAVIVDPGVLPSEMADINKFLTENDLDLEGILFTHTHGDHIAGWNHLPAVPLFMGSNFRLKTEDRKEKDLKFIQNIFRSNHIETKVPIKFPHKYELIENGKSILVGGMEYYFYSIPGHSVDMNLILVPEINTVLSGDMLIQSPFPFILESVLQYRMSLGYIRRIVVKNEIETCIPGHFKEASGEQILGRIQSEIQYIDELYGFLFDEYDPSMSIRELEEAMLHMDPKRVNVHFTHKMNVHQLIAEIKHLL